MAPRDQKTAVAPERSASAANLTNGTVHTVRASAVAGRTGKITPRRNHHPRHHTPSELRANIRANPPT